jgi:hypothetical protein
VAAETLARSLNVFATQRVFVVVTLSHQNRFVPKVKIIAGTFAGCPKCIQLHDVLFAFALSLAADQEAQDMVVWPDFHPIHLPIQTRLVTHGDAAS